MSKDFEIAASSSASVEISAELKNIDDQSVPNGDLVFPVVIIHWNCPGRCVTTVNAFLDQCADVRVFIVDNGSEESAQDALHGLVGPRVTLHRLGRNIGFGPAASYGLDLAFAETAADVAALAPHDALPQPLCLPRIRESILAEPTRGLAGAEPYDSSEQRFDWLRGVYVRPRPPHPIGWNDALFPTGTLMVLRRTCWSAVGPFDPRYFAYAEEHDLGLRALNAGWKVGMIGGAIVKNSDRTISSKGLVYLNLRNSLLLVQAHAGWLPAILRTIVIVANTLLIAFHLTSGLPGSTIPVRLRAVSDFFRRRFGPPPTL